MKKFKKILPIKKCLKVNMEHIYVIGSAKAVGEMAQREHKEL